MATVQISGARPRRVVEMLLMLLALFVGIGGYVLTTLNRTGEVPANLTLYVGLLVGLAVIAEIGVHFFAPYADPVILPVATALTGLGLAMIFRLDQSYAALGQPTVGTRQLMLTGLALAVAAVILAVLRDHRVLRRFTYTFGVISLLLLASPMIPGIGVEHLGARIWINIFGFQLQPAEFVKVTLAIFFAGYLVANRDKLSIAGPKILGLRLPRLRDLGPIVLVWLLGIGILVFQRDLGTSLLFFGLFVAMLYVATDRVSWLILGALMFLPAAFVVVKAMPHIQNRFDVWLHALDPEYYDQSYQVVQGIFGLANGGLLGTGWGRGYPHLVPFAQSDFILAALGEELGLVGLLAILMLYLILVERGLRAALGTRDGFGKLLAAGLSFSIALQVFVVLGGITRVIPLTGLTAPFLAQGGSSMMASWMIVALLLRISDGSRRPAPQRAPWKGDSVAVLDEIVAPRQTSAPAATPTSDEQMTDRLPTAPFPPLSGRGNGQ